MKLTLNLHSLMRAIEIMEPERSGKFTLELHETHIDKITAELEKGKDVELKDVEIESGLLSYKGRHVTLYIKANGTSARFHVSDCSTLQGMRASGRFERYVVTNNTSGEFLVDTSYGEKKARLKVCQNCLRKLNYKGCNTTTNITSVVQNFNMAEFFATYSSFFPHMPSRRAETAESGYSDDWSKISSHYRVEKNFECEECKVNMRSQRALLHVHHVNGVKSDNRPSNLRALCIDCHSKQPMHEHMALSHRERQTINDLRKQQGLFDDLGEWQELFDYSDPGVHGVLHACRQAYLQLPDINYFVEDSFGGLAARLELAWPKHKFGVAISMNDIEDASSNGWQVVGINDFLENYKSQAYNLRH
ncbi:TPA: HNH endonuclease [Vibrio vulnificus]|uniref:HNH endonuclease n=1 Tax=Vibrio vulnificus TaxID=672 RepID=UPI001302C4EB|nr:HNH endonuclease signature motif containing protein [Vibrio vulnificus]MCA3952532.1 HNH endonuclease [Vibrio vulnificus]MCU8204489.1 HNH endonuclease [Vibrio vulnificus]HAS8421895.1 HNH endonuclease [Vibrio vulnificus]